MKALAGLAVFLGATLSAFCILEFAIEPMGTVNPWIERLIPLVAGTIVWAGLGLITKADRSGQAS